VADDGSPGRDDRGRRAHAASRGVPDPKAIPDGPDWKVRAVSREHRASRGGRARRVRKVPAANPDRRANPASGAKQVRAANPVRPANCRESNR
jgi:hypothetical protein